MKRAVTILAVAALGMPATLMLGPRGGAAAQRSATGSTRAVHTDRVVLTHGAGERVTDADLVRAGLHGARVLRRIDATRTLVALSGQMSGTALRSATSSALNVPGVVRVEADIKMRVTEIDDPRYIDNTQWHLQPAAEYAGSAEPQAAWDTVSGAGTTIAVIDTGHRGHRDIAEARVLAGYDMISDVPTANDGDGRDADPSDPGDWVSEADAAQEAFTGCAVEPSSWHGLHVSGIAAASANNAVDGAGLAFGANLLPVRALGKCGGYDSDIADAVRWAAGLSVPGVPANANPADVINMSLGGAGDCSTLLQDAIDAARSQGAIVVVSAGNSNLDLDTDLWSPANCDGVVSVASITSSGAKSAFSNHGAAIDVAAPGSGIHSTLNDGTTGPGSDTFVAYSGTSMAAPLVAATFALMRSVRSDLVEARMVSLLQAGTRSFAGGGCTTATCGAGMLSAGGAVGAVRRPGAPGAVSAVGGEGAATVSWTAPEYTGTSGIASYTATEISSNKSCTWSSGPLNCTIAGLGAGSYSFAVRGVNTGGHVGFAAQSAPVSVTGQSTTTTTVPETTTTVPETATTTTTTVLETTTTTVGVTTTTVALGTVRNPGIRFDGADLVITADPAPGGVRYLLERDGVRVGESATPVWSDTARATMTGKYVYRISTLRSDGTVGAVLELGAVTVSAPGTPRITASRTGNKVKIVVRFAKGKLSADVWCVFVNGSQRSCASVRTTVRTISVRKGVSAVSVRVYRTTGASRMSNAVRIRY